MEGRNGGEGRGAGKGKKGRRRREFVLYRRQKKRKVGAYERKCADTIDTVLVLGLAISSDKI